jgi:hypothetical protein
MDRLDLGWIHGNAVLGDDVAQVGNRAHSESALGTLDEEAVLSQHGEDRVEVPKVVRPSGDVDEDIIINKHEPVKE